MEVEGNTFHYSPGTVEYDPRRDPTISKSRLTDAHGHTVGYTGGGLRPDGTPWSGRAYFSAEDILRNKARQNASSAAPRPTTPQPTAPPLSPAAPSQKLSAADPFRHKRQYA